MRNVMMFSKQSQWIICPRATVNKLLLLVIGLGILTGCVFPLQPPTPAAPAATGATSNAAAPLDPQQSYAVALQDAKVAERDEVFDGLTAITPTNESLIWQPEQGQVLMVTWTSWNGYDAQVGKEMQLAREVWVTAAPQLETFCQAYQAAPEVSLILRLEQLLGLPPNNGKTRVVELWVHSADMFRPSPDAEIDDTVAELELPGPERFASQQEYEFHRDWYNLQLTLDNYDDPATGYPWTRLGYTYDWGNSDSEIGLSEFVVTASSTVMVEQVYATEEYCTE